ncbi:uncharacterized protein LOC142165127 [Nicotiana tabacum]|uniref:Uncharacterized protein LOC142165127 n=1 Tax=Nicotiana tabacum TaxID=4097 RepID=A0AC58S4F4_TOBAC
MALEIKILQLEIYGDSKLIINQLLGSYEVKKEDLLSYHEYASGLLEKFDRVFLNHVPREENRKVDALANLATTMALAENESTKGKLPEDSRQRTDIKLRAPRFIFYKGTLFRRSFEGLFLRCLNKEEAFQAMEEAHSSSCGAHQSGPKLHFHIKRMGYYWATMVKDCIDHAKRCQVCQFHANYIHQPPEPLHPTVASWTFDAWGLDVVGPLPKSSKGHINSPTVRATNSIIVDSNPKGLTSEENAQLCLVELEALDDKGLEAQQKLECYQARLARAFNKKVRPRSFQVGDLVLAVRRPIILNKRIGDKFTSKWDGPYVLKETYSSGAYKIVNKDGLRVGPMNGKFLKQYFP